MKTNKTPQKKGKDAENEACIFLQKNHYIIVKRNYRRAGGEVDIICSQQNILIFAEVKMRKNMDICEFSISKYQTKRIENMAEIFLSEHSEFIDYDIRFDAIYIANNKVKHLKDAWRPEFY